MHNDIKVVHSKPAPKLPLIATPIFKTPEEVASHDTVLPLEQNNNVSEIIMPSIKRHKKFWPPTKKQSLIGGGILLVLLVIISGSVYMAGQYKPTTAVIAVTKTKPKPAVKVTNTVASTLSGLPVAPAANQRPITAIMIENTPAARPQSGLSQAGVVFEALAEGGITRFMALFQDQLPSNVGPIRSVRPYYLDWALGFDAPLAHVGGSPQALADIPTLGIKNLDYMFYPGSYTRISSRQAPHNVYTSIANLISLEAKLGWSSSSFSGWARKADAPAQAPTATTINFNPSYATYNDQYSYNKTTNSYNRSEGGAPQIGATNNNQLSPKVVIGLIVPWTEGALDSSNAYYSVYQDLGSGPAYVFQDGSLTIGQWNKATAQTPLTFTDANGQPLKLNAGQTWITALASSNEISYN